MLLVYKQYMDTVGLFVSRDNTTECHMLHLVLVYAEAVNLMGKNTQKLVL